MTRSKSILLVHRQGPQGDEISCGLTERLGHEDAVVLPDLKAESLLESGTLRPGLSHTFDLEIFPCGMSGYTSGLYKWAGARDHQNAPLNLAMNIVLKGLGRYDSIRMADLKKSNITQKTILIRLSEVLSLVFGHVFSLIRRHGNS
jgi:hypothetical protein